MKKILLSALIVSLISGGCNTNKKPLQVENNDSTTTQNYIDPTINSNNDYIPLPTSNWQIYSSSLLGISAAMPKDWFVSKTTYFYPDKEEGVNFMSDKNRKNPYIEFVISRSKNNPSQTTDEVYKSNWYFDYTLPNGLTSKRKLDVTQQIQWIIITHNNYDYLFTITIHSDQCPGNANHVYCDYTPEQQSLIKTVLSTFKFSN